MNQQMKLVRKKTLLRSLTILIAAASTNAAAEDTAEPKYTVSAISDAAYGAKILAGDYEAAVGKIRQSSSVSMRTFYAANNLCVAYVQLRDFANAGTACDSAVAVMRKILDTTRKHAPSHAANRKFLAIAMSNRGVFRAINGDEELARKDFSDAIELEARIAAPATNMARLTREATPQA